MISPRGLALCAFVACAGAVRAATYHTEASATWAENIARSSAPSDWRDTLRLELGAGASAFKQWTAGLITTGEVDAHYERVPRFARLDALTAGVGAQARQKFGFGAFAPVLSFDGAVHGRDARRDGDDGWTVDAAARLGKRLTSSWRIAAQTDWQQHYARSDIFATRHHRFFGTVAWDITDRLQLAYGRGRLWGDFTANASPGVWSRAISGAFGPAIYNYYTTTSWGETDTMGPGWITYRVSGRVTFWWLELSPALGRDTSLPLRYESRYSENRAGVHYRQDLWTLQWLRRF